MVDLNKPYLFISHSPEDEAVVQGLRRALGNLGLDVWSEPPDLRGRVHQFGHEIQLAIEVASAFVVLVSPASRNSEWAGQELRHALIAKARRPNNEYPIILLSLQDAKLDPSGMFAPQEPRYIPVGNTPGEIEAAAQAILSALGMDQPADQASARQAARRIRIPHIAWVEIPAGPFIYQEGETRELPTFWIAKYPVTNIQYQCFIDDGGYADERWWRDLRRPEREEPRWEQANRPRTNVDWYEAVAFSRWLCARLGQKDGSVRLPTEEEWEKAARGTDGRVYPWGPEYRSGYANVDESWGKAGEWYLQQTTAVGVYPHGGSPQGVHDLAGTVWEWCLNKYEKPEESRADSSGDIRVLRGGSWLNYPDNARADFRNWDRPDDRDDGNGFRLVSSVPIAGER